MSYDENDDKDDGHLYFTFQEFIEEIDAILEIANRFIESKYALEELKTQLQNIREAAPGKTYTLSIKDQGQALQTIASKGEYEPGRRRGDEHVFARITSLWQIQPIGQHGSKYSQRRKFVVAGNASTRIELFRAGFAQGRKDQLVAMWRMELGTDDSPGCFFHVQVLGQDKDRKRPPFPKSIHRHLQQFLHEISFSLKGGQPCYRTGGTVGRPIRSLVF